ncbi:biopolymer transporter ExbD [Sulfitobacter sp. LCG007]
MDLGVPPKRPRGESIVPMINVVFLLLIFFLMTSKLTQPEPFEVTPPVADSDMDVEAEAVLFVNRAGVVSFEGQEGAQAIAALAGRQEQPRVIRLRADSGLEAKRLASLLRDLSGAGLSSVELIVTRE